VEFEKNISLLMKLFITAMRKKKAAYISVNFFGKKTFSQIMKALGFVKTETKEKLMILIKKDSAQATLLSTPENWIFFDGDTDYIPTKEEELR